MPSPPLLLNDKNPLSINRTYVNSPVSSPHPLLYACRHTYVCSGQLSGVWFLVNELRSSGLVANVLTHNHLSSPKDFFFQDSFSCSPDCYKAKDDLECNLLSRGITNLHHHSQFTDWGKKTQAFHVLSTLFSTGLYAGPETLCTLPVPRQGYL